MDRIFLNGFTSDDGWQKKIVTIFQAWVTSHSFIHLSVYFVKKGVIFGEKIQFREVTIFAPKSKKSEIVIFIVSEK